MRDAFDPRGVTRGLGTLGGLLAAPAARWDAAWYLVIAHYGYRPDLGALTSSRTAFFPLYPLALGALARLGVPPIAAGVGLSVAALALALYGIHGLTTLELAHRRRGTGARAGIAVDGAEAARSAVLVTAWAPMAFFFSAVYPRALYLALSVGVFLCARQGRWAWVGVLGALATASSGTGVVLCWRRRRCSTCTARARIARGDSVSPGAGGSDIRLRAGIFPVARARARGSGWVHGLPGAGGRRR